MNGDQWPIIQGRPQVARTAGSVGLESCAGFAAADTRRGSCAARSFTAYALRTAAARPGNTGAVRMSRLAGNAHREQGCGASRSLIARSAVNPPQSAQSYS